MNPEVIKAMQGKKTLKMQTWWHKNNYKVMRIILFPVWLGAILIDKYNILMNKKQAWNEARANAILNYYIPRFCEWNKEGNYFYFFDNGWGWNLKLAKKYLKRKDYRFWKVNTVFDGGKIRNFLIEKFELEGFVKEVGNCSNGWTDVTFYLDNKKSA